MPLSIISRRHPDLVLLLLSQQATLGGRILLEIDVIDSQPVDFAKEIRRMSDVVSVSRLGARQSRTRFRLVVRPPKHVILAIELGAILRYPIVIRNGQCTWVVEASVTGLRRLLRGLRRLSNSVKMLSWGREEIPTFPPALSSRQQALLYQAIAAGYFDVPRRITLTALAGEVHRSKSSISRALSLIENRLVESSVLASV